MPRHFLDIFLVKKIYDDILSTETQSSESFNYFSLINNEYAISVLLLKWVNSEYYKISWLSWRKNLNIKYSLGNFDNISHYDLYDKQNDFLILGPNCHLQQKFNITKKKIREIQPGRRVLYKAKSIIVMSSYIPFYKDCCQIAQKQFWQHNQFKWMI